MKKFLLSLVALMTIGVSAWADGVTVPQTRIAASRFSKLKVTLESTTPYRDLQFDLTLPEGITLKDTENGGTVVDEASNHVIQYAAEGSTLHFVVVDAIADVYDGTDATNYTGENLPDKDSYGKTFTSGIIVEIPINAAATFSGTQTASLANLSTSNDAGDKVDLTDGSFNIKAVLLGDVNDDGFVDPTDALNIQYFYLNDVPDDFVEEAGYVTEEDEEIDPTDALEVQYIYLESGVKKMRNGDVVVKKDDVSTLDPE